MIDERDRRHLLYIRESVARIRRYTSGGREEFLRDELLQDAVLRRLETLAEATDKLPDELKARHPDVPWRAVYGFRNIAAHAYIDLDLDRAWEIVEDHLAPVESAVDAELGVASDAGTHLGEARTSPVEGDEEDVLQHPQPEDGGNA